MIQIMHFAPYQGGFIAVDNHNDVWKFTIYENEAPRWVFLSHGPSGDDRPAWVNTPKANA